MVVALALLREVLGTICLDHKSCFGTVEIYNKGFYDSLLVDFNRILAQKQIP